MKVAGPLELAGAEEVATDPVTDLFMGRTVYNTAQKSLKVYNTDSSVWQGVGGGGGGAGLRWVATEGAAPIKAIEEGYLVWKFSTSHLESMQGTLKVPASYTGSVPIKLRLGGFSLSSGGQTWKFQTVATLIEPGTPVNDVTDQETFGTTDQVAAVSREYRELVFELTDATGNINGNPVSAGDYIKVVLSRVAPGAGTEDPLESRIIDDLTEVEIG